MSQTNWNSYFLLMIQMYYTLVKTWKNVIYVLNDEVKNMSIWFKINKLSLNVEKTNYMIFKSKSENNDYKVVIDGMNVEKVQVAKFLGVKVDDQLTWNDQINSVYKNLSKNISILYSETYID